MNRHGKIHKGHYEPWLTQHINDLRLQLGLPAIYNEPGVHKYALHLADSDESFGISTLPRSLMDLYNIRAADSSLLSTRNKTSSSDLASLIILHGSTAHTAGSQFIFMAQRQGAAHAIIPVQTQVERNKYDSLIRQHFPQQLQRNQQPDFDKFSKLWSAFVDGKSIFYKAPEHLRSYHTKWCEYQNIHLTKNSYNEQIETLQQDLSSPSRKRNIPEAQNPAALKIPRLQAIIDEATASSSPLSTEEETGNTEHINSNFTSTSYETIHNITTTTNTVEPTIFYNPYLSQQLLYPPFPFIYAAPSSSTSTFDGLHTPPRVRHCKTCHSNTCIGRTGRGKCSLLNNT